MKKFKILPLVLISLLCLGLLPSAALAADEPDIGAAAAMLVDADTGEVYYELNADRRVQPASTTKIVTAMLTLEAVARGDIALSDNVTAYDDCQAGMDELSSHADPAIEPGEVMTVESLLYCAMLASANEACNILGEYVAGSIGDFVALMNARVAELGCTGTHFANTNGLEDEDHYTTASDFAIIAREALKSAQFQQICGAATYTVPGTNLHDERRLANTNLLLDPESEFYFEYAYGIKTGFFTTAGYCLVSAAEKDDMDVICVLMGGAEPGDQFRDSVTLYDWLFDHYESRQILSSTTALITVPVVLGTSDSTGVRAENSISAVLPVDYDMSNVKLQAVLYHEAEHRELDAPVNAGEVLGEVTVVEVDEYGNVVRTFGTSPLVATSTVEMSRIEYLRTQVTELFQNPVVRRIITVLIILLAVYLLLVLFYYIQRVRHLRSLRRAKRERALRQAEYEAEWLDIPGERDEDEAEGVYLGRGRGPSLRESEPADEPQPELDDDYFDSFFRD